MKKNPELDISIMYVGTHHSICIHRQTEWHAGHDFQVYFHFLISHIITRAKNASVKLQQAL
jgi:hypothetical protein